MAITKRRIKASFGEDGGDGTRMVWAFFRSLFAPCCIEIEVNIDTIKKGRPLEGKQGVLQTWFEEEEISQEALDSFVEDPIHADTRCGILSILSVEDAVSTQNKIFTISEDAEEWRAESMVSMIP